MCALCESIVCLPLWNKLQHVSDDEIKLQTYFFPSAVFDVTAHVVVVPSANQIIMMLFSCGNGLDDWLVCPEVRIHEERYRFEQLLLRQMRMLTDSSLRVL